MCRRAAPAARAEVDEIHTPPSRARGLGRDFAAKQKAEAGMAEMSEKFRESGSEIYVPAAAD
jgi:hypothetical protein